MIIQFGYVTLFAASFPLAALCAMVNNVTEIRSDAWLLCRGHQRPEWRTQEDIGSWSRILFFISMINTMVNAALTAFVGAQLDETNGTFTTRIRSYRLWMIAIALEHCVLMLRVFVLNVVPDTPSYIEALRKRQEWFERTMKDGEQILAERELQEQSEHFSAAADVTDKELNKGSIFLHMGGDMSDVAESDAQESRRKRKKAAKGAPTAMKTVNPLMLDPTAEGDGDEME